MKVLLPAAAILGCGGRGRAWGALFLRAGWDVALFDPDPDAALAAQARLGALTGPDTGCLRVASRISDAVTRAIWIVECAPERLALKRKLYQKVQAHCDRASALAAATSAFSASTLQSCATTPPQIFAISAEVRPTGLANAVIRPGKHSTRARLGDAQAALSRLGLDARIEAPD